MKGYLLRLLCAFLLLPALAGAAPNLRAWLDRDTARLGESVTLNVEADGRQALLLGALSSAFATALMASLVVIPGVNVAQANTTVQASGSTVIVNTSPATSVDTVEDTTEAVPSGDGYV